jgi:hypothetical protein
VVVTTFKVLCDKAKDLAALLKPKQRNAAPPEAITEACRAIDRLKAALLQYLPPSAQEKREAKAHPRGSQIAIFTTADRERKRFFNLTYFQNKFRALPVDERRLIASTAPKTVAGFRDALILYYCRAGKIAGQDLLKKFQADMENEYNSLPQVTKYNHFKSLYRELLVTRDRIDIVSRLSAEFAEENGLMEFAGTNKLKIPAQKKGKNAPRTTPHERLAEVIFKKGTLARLDIE